MYELVGMNTNPIREYTRFDRNWPELIGTGTNGHELLRITSTN